MAFMQQSHDSMSWQPVVVGQRCRQYRRMQDLPRSDSDLVVLWQCELTRNTALVS